jgi:hypothetical protein
MTHTFRLTHNNARKLAADLCREAPEGTIVTFKAATRSLEQNARMWSMLSDLAAQVDWYGKKLTAEDWKDVCTASLRKARVVPTIDGDGFVPLGMRTSSMTVGELGALMDLIEAFGAQHGVAWSHEAAKVAQLESLKR